MAFLACVGFSVYGALQRLLYCVPAPLNAALAKLSKLHLKEAKGIEFERWIFGPMRPLVGKSWS